ACTKTASSGRTRKSSRKPRASAMSTMRVSGLSVTAERGATFRSAGMSSTIAEPPATPCLDEIDDQEHEEGNGKHDRGHGGRRRVVVFFQPDDDQQRRDLGNIRNVAGAEDHRSIFSH